MITIRPATEADLEEVADLVRGFVAGHPAEPEPRPRADGGELLHGGAEVDVVSKLYERVAVGSPGRSCYVSGEAFHAFADLAGLPVREIVSRLPDPALNREPPRAR